MYLRPEKNIWNNVFMVGFKTISDSWHILPPNNFLNDHIASIYVENVLTKTATTLIRPRREDKESVQFSGSIYFHLSKFKNILFNQVRAWSHYIRRNVNWLLILTRAQIYTCFHKHDVGRHSKYVQQNNLHYRTDLHESQILQSMRGSVSCDSLHCCSLTSNLFIYQARQSLAW